MITNCCRNGEETDAASAKGARVRPSQQQSNRVGSLSKRRAHAHSHFHGTDPLDLAA